ncbi:hypothetical protein H9L10_05175 [Phycicoccus endophyticus]|uniref:Uncharacterized protein n=1 Tax=Phycicoccus endophyticus TaxID=1690220 RepID=A0A7G9R483_9MICO|nr:hypothetical protein [Phycicoccus endophyticus]NHI18261.1 hypothetical protein [Phycicoccus endophyticus]QNN50408.1 hypothetical protein H9L10_05175 [Phycicoccus endophyticus]GGL25161.1 hypothetical protein GCM10012283_04140 [Phycicoccus endophyticus]
MNPHPTSTPSDASMCPDADRPGTPRSLFPPADADAETYRDWLASSPWPEVVFASAGAR